MSDNTEDWDDILKTLFVVVCGFVIILGYGYGFMWLVTHFAEAK